MSYTRKAFARAQRRKSPWNLALIPGVLAPFAALWYGSATVLGALYRVRHQGADFVLLPDSGAGIAMAIAPLFAWLAPAMILGNFLVWLVPPARHSLDLEAKGHPGTSFTEANRGLLRFALFVTPAALAVALAAAFL